MLYTHISPKKMLYTHIKVWLYKISVGASWFYRCYARALPLQPLQTTRDLVWAIEPIRLPYPHRLHSPANMEGPMQYLAVYYMQLCMGSRSILLGKHIFPLEPRLSSSQSPLEEHKNKLKQ